jgi:hypothetical protein
MYKDREEIEKLEIEDLLNIDLEKINNLKDKANDLIEACNDSSGDQKDELSIYFNEKLNELHKNETNLQTFINNIDKVDTLVFYENKTQVNFNI